MYSSSKVLRLILEMYIELYIYDFFVLVSVAKSCNFQLNLTNLKKPIQLFTKVQNKKITITKVTLLFKGLGSVRLFYLLIIINNNKKESNNFYINIILKKVYILYSNDIKLIMSDSKDFFTEYLQLK